MEPNETLTWAERWMADWFDIAKAVGEGLAVSLPLIGTMAFFHGKNNEARSKLESKVDLLSKDFDGLTEQLSVSAIQAERRFVARDEYAQSINRLDSNVVELTRTLGKFSEHLIDIARDNRPR